MRTAFVTVVVCAAMVPAIPAAAQRTPGQTVQQADPATTLAGAAASTGNTVTCPASGCVLDLRGAAQPRLEIRGSTAGTTAAMSTIVRIPRVRS
jgi:hypothetical protein